jgi:hypothetical protein
MVFHKLGTYTTWLFLQQSKHGVNSIKIENSAKSFFSNVDLVWKDEFRHKGQNKVAIETAYISHAYVSKLLESEERDMQTLIKWNVPKNLPPQ